MPTPNPLREPELEFKALLVLVLAATILFALILAPYFGAVCWAVFIALVFWPLQQRIVRNTRGRRSVAALATLLIVVLIVILPLSLVAATVAEEASTVMARLRSGELQPAHYFQQIVEVLPAWVQAILQRLGVTELGVLQQKVLAAVGQSGQSLTARAFSIGQVTLDFVVGFFVMIYVLFFLLRDGDKLAAGVARSIPLRQQHTERLLAQFATVVRATVKGNVAVALVQGALGGAAFLVLGVAAPMLWGAVMALLSLLPAVGAAIVWGPVALYLLVTGSVFKALGLVLWGVLVIGLVDNVLRPILVGKDTRMPDYLILIATLGGLAVFGLNGFVIGPVIAAIFLVSWEMLAAAREQPVAPERPARRARDQDTM
jgi:predicted PurR-regulated permease PerM